MSCAFNVCSLFTDVKETIATLPNDPNDLKSILMSHLGVCQSGSGSAEGVDGGNKCGPSSSATSTPNNKDGKDIFKHPITYTNPEALHELPLSIIEDLEMIHPKPMLGDISGEKEPETEKEKENEVDTKETINNEKSIRGLYHYVFSPTSVYGNEYLPLWSKYYSTDIEYLKQTQSLLNEFDTEMLNRAITQYTSCKTSDEAFSTMKTTWTDFRGTGKVEEFKEKFSYVETPFLSKLNQSSSFLQVLSIYNLSSPVITLLTPIIVLIIPFFILLMRGLSVSVSEYVEILKTIISQHSIGKILTEFDTVPFEQKMYILMSVIFYFVQIYQNIMACIRFYRNIKLVHTHLATINGYLTATGVSMTYMIQLIQTYKLTTYDGFKNELLERYALLTDFTRALTEITPFSCSVSKFFQVGYVMKNYYALFSQSDLSDLLDYSFGFNAYIEHLSACRKLVISGTLNSCEFIKDAGDSAASSKSDEHHDDDDETLPTIVEETETETENAEIDAESKKDDDVKTETEAAPNANNDSDNNNNKYSTKLFEQIYATLSEKAAVPNDICLNKQLIITGPNAAGKTTIIKTTLFNIILSQQIGFGFYKRAEINPYDHLHCYLNIPDTSGRDSLFQAESRRCMEILTCVIQNPKKRHFCIFDELYSGTNPYEAIASAYGYIEFISKNPNVDLILTTHYIELCELLGKHKRIENLHMSTGEDGAYLYKLAQGISSIKGGLKVLIDLEYPAEIVDSARRIIEKK